MNIRTLYVVIAIVTLVGGLTIMPAFGQQLGTLDRVKVDAKEYAKQATMNRTPITVWTDKNSYDHESIIQVEGYIPNSRPGTEVGLKVIGPPPFNNIVTIDQLKVNNDGTFKTSLSTAGPAWKFDGTYTIRVAYGGQDVFNTVQVELVEGPIIGCGPGTFAAGGQCISYSISGAQITNSRISVADKSLIINLVTTSDGFITIDIPRNVLDTDSISEPLFVLVDGEEVDSVERADATKRVVTIEFPRGAEQIEIIGTFVIPEFGTIAVVILAVSIIAIIAISAKTRLNVLPKY